MIPIAEPLTSKMGEQNNEEMTGETVKEWLLAPPLRHASTVHALVNTCMHIILKLDEQSKEGKQKIKRILSDKLMERMIGAQEILC